MVLDGDPGLGKSTVTLDLAARLSTGARMPHGPSTIGPVNVVVLSAEDGLADTIRPRLDAAGGDPKRVVTLTISETTSSAASRSRATSLGSSALYATKEPHRRHRPTRSAPG